MEQFPRGRAAIVGAATYGMGESPGMRPLDLAAQAAVLALQDAGLGLDAVDALFVCTPDDALSGLSAAEYLGIAPRFTENNRTGGSAFHSHVITASLMLDAGYCDVALIIYGSNQRTASGGLVSMRLPSPYEKPYKPLTPLSSYALAASRHMHEYGTTREHLAEVAVAARSWARLNPEAFARDELTIEDCLKARMVSDPLSVRDCCLVTDGAAAVVLTRADRARDLQAQPIHVLGAAAATWYSGVDQSADLTVTAARESGPACLCHCRCRSAGYRCGTALRCLHHQHHSVPRGSRLLPQGRGRTFRVRRQHRSWRFAAGQYQWRWPVLLPPWHVRIVHPGRVLPATGADRPATVRFPVHAWPWHMPTAAPCPARRP
ncbi:thiolase [Pseudomonas aeruginosa]|nr:thiolase [Pseudomonas aeruginosa]